MSRQTPAAALAAVLFCTLLSGCATTKRSDTSRTGMEQLLVSDAIDRSIAKIDLRPLAGKSVFVDPQYLDCVDKGYVVSSLRHRVVTAGARLAANADDADLIAEVRSGGVGTDRQQSYVGTPNISLPGITPIEIPEVKLWNKDRQLATAKIGLMVYDAKTRLPLGPGGMSLARSDDTNTFVAGIGPWQTGSVKTSIAEGVRSGRVVDPLPYRVAVNQPPVGAAGVRLAAGEADAAPATPPAAPPAAPPAEDPADPFAAASPLFDLPAPGFQ